MNKVDSLTMRGEPSRNIWLDAVDRFVGNRLAVVGLAIVFVFVFTAIFGSFLAPYDPFEQNLRNTFKPPSVRHWLGTDDLGRDILSRLMVSAKTALLVAFISVSISLLIGTIFGLLAGYMGPKVDAVIMWLNDVTQSIPQLLLAMILVISVRIPVNNWVDRVYSDTDWEIFSPTGRGWVDFVIIFGVLALISWPSYARLIRGQVLKLSQEDFVMAARSVGASEWRIMLKHILPNAMGPIIVMTTYNIGTAIVSEAGLSFLGIGVQPPNTSWGSMLAQGWKVWVIAPHIMLAPAIAVALVRITFNFLGDGLSEALNPSSGKI